MSSATTRGLAYRTPSNSPAAAAAPSSRTRARSRPSNGPRKKNMEKLFITLGALALSAIGCDKMQEGNLREPRIATSRARPAIASVQEPAQVAGASRKLFLDLHELGPGKVTSGAVAAAHQKDLATQAKYGAEFKAYWLDESAGKIYCLVEAPDVAAVNAVHKE